MLAGSLRLSYASQRSYPNEQCCQDHGKSESGGSWLDPSEYQELLVCTLLFPIPAPSSPVHDLSSINLAFRSPLLILLCLSIATNSRFEESWVADCVDPHSWSPKMYRWLAFLYGLLSVVRKCFLDCLRHSKRVEIRVSKVSCQFIVNFLKISPSLLVSQPYTYFFFSHFTVSDSAILAQKDLEVASTKITTLKAHVHVCACCTCRSIFSLVYL